MSCPNDTITNREFKLVWDCRKDLAEKLSCPTGFKEEGGVSECTTAECKNSTCWLTDTPYQKTCYRSVFYESPENKIKCCLGEADLTKCPPGLCKNSPQCRKLMKEHCSKGNNFTKDECQGWCRSVRTGPEEFRADCDSVSTAYCRSHPNEKVCKCQLNDPTSNPNSKISKLNAKLNTPYECWYLPCRDIGKNDTYITYSQQQRLLNSCPTVQCIISDVEVEAGNFKNSTSEIKNECSSNVKPEFKDELLGSDFTSSDKTNGDGSDGSGSNNNDEGLQPIHIAGIAVGIVFLIVVIVLIVMMTRR